MSETAFVTELRGAYTADRAAALAGVPVSTVHYWACKDILAPSLSPERVKLWSYSDLMALRVIYWLRHAKQRDGGPAIKATAMPTVRAALAALRDLDLTLWSDEDQPSVRVGHAGNLYIGADGRWQDPAGHIVLEETLDLRAPFSSDEATGPHLRVPRPRLRILPGKLGGAPHVEGTRIETEALAALADRGIPAARIAQLYPAVERAAIDEAIELEQQLTANARIAA